MYREDPVVRTKLTPPPVQKHTLNRPRLTRQLLEGLDYRLTVVQAGTGYGKSTALAALAGADHAVAWYHLDVEDIDPLVFLRHLLHSFRATSSHLSAQALAALEGWNGGGNPPWETVVDILVNELAEQSEAPILLILDDVHVLNQGSDSLGILDRLIRHAPANLHVILATRYPPQLATLVGWRVKGRVLEIGQAELAFTRQEIASLFRDHYRVFLTNDELDQVATETEGWAIALQLIWQTLRSGAVTTLSQALGRLAGPEQDLFTYLAQEVLEQQPPDVREFLLSTVVLRELTPSVCDCLREAGDSRDLLRYVLESGLFVVNLGDGHLRYHHLFRDFLCHQLTEQEESTAHRRAAACCQRLGKDEEAIYHLLRAEAFDEAADVLDRVGRDVVRAGRLDTLAGWIGNLPPETLEAHPALLVHLGDIARLHSRFDEALGWYRQAETRSRARDDASAIGRALRGQARVYLDTVNPTKAQHLLQEALKLSDGQADRATRARLLELMAENQLNLGRPDEAEALRRKARALREEGPGEAELRIRVLLRTGQLNKARRLLEERLEDEALKPVLRPRAHRETLLLLSLIMAFQGDGEDAYACAKRGTSRGRDLGSPYVTAVGHMREGHAWLLRESVLAHEQACQNYQKAIALGNSLAVPRLKVEAFWGLCRARGFAGELAAAEEAAQRGIAIAERAGDEWIAALIRLSLAAAYALWGRDEPALDDLDQALTAFRECGDTFGEAVTRLWQCLVWERRGDEARLMRGISELLATVREHGYDYLLQRQTLLGPPDSRRVVPLLLIGRHDGRQRPYAELLLQQLGLRELEIHPGYQLRVQSLGPFRVWRGKEEIAPDAWQREKARHLFQFLITHRDRLLERDQIVEMMWPGLDTETGRRDFKVVLSTLRQVLEPNREAGAPSAYVARDGSRYGLRHGADVSIDVLRFEELVSKGDEAFDGDPDRAMDYYEEALQVYQDDYLRDCLYEDWCSAERERLLTLYLHTADRVVQVRIERGAWEGVIPICQAILKRDDCWEQAYRSMMTAYAEMGYRVQALRTYQRCARTLRETLDIKPSKATNAVHEAIR
jgi:ATP/maltotriose-dependent transcriptional regulator MalT/DNA-binding SARP family transcriptional activator